MHGAAPPPIDALSKFVPQHDSFVGIDSDGCVFDTMEIKQKQCFHGLIAAHWGLTAIEPALREVAEFVNLYSAWRGQNRFTALLKVFELLREHPAAVAAGMAGAVPELPRLRALVESGKPLGNPTLQDEAQRTGNAELHEVLRWSLAVNERVEAVVRDVPPFPWAQRSLELVARHSDAVCVSQTPYEALAREWRAAGIDRHVALLAGQELGTKTEHLRLATAGRYRPERVLMIGDALGDLAAARANRAGFYPVNPAAENASWERFHDEAYARFLNGTYAGAYEQALVTEFERLLPRTPPWQAP